jgi:GR25 family glycosyltransferase involved in LPS biosynthesis
MLFEIINKAYIINVKSSIYRYNHCLYELQKIPKLNFEIIEAITPNSQEVKSFYKNNYVKEFPPCFRCNLELCDHKNNVLIPRQVANFLSFKKVFQKISESHINEKKLFLVLEDDFVLQKGYKKSFKSLENYITKKNLINIDEPLLFRIGSHTRSIKRVNLKFKILGLSTFTYNNYNMANPAFIVNKEYCKLFLNEFKLIDTTSDDYIHKILCKNFNVKNFSIEPFPISQLSYGSKQNVFKSDINVNTTNKEDIEKVVNKKEYKDLKKIWSE